MYTLEKVKLKKSRGVKLSNLAKKEEKSAYRFLLPWLAGLLLFLLIPILGSVGLSFTQWNLMNPPEWVGGSNYTHLVSDHNYLNSIRVTLKYLILAVPLYMVAGLGLSLLLNLRIRGMNVFRTILYLPSVLSTVAVAVLWLSLLNPDLGAVNQILRAIGIANPPRWLQSQDWAVPAVVLMGLWGVGGGAIIYLAGLQNISPILYEAAEIDGANAVQKFFHITIPLLTPTLFFVLITSLIGAFQMFEGPFVLGGSRGGRSGALLFYLLNLYNEGFRSARFGYASAMSWVLIVAAGIVIFVAFKLADRWVYYESDGG
jgi:multiple sugar transport system permease protein